MFTAYCIILLVMSLIAFVMYAYDKKIAGTGKRRIRERTLLLLAALCGGIGAFAAMRLFRHKTQHRNFTTIVPLCMLAQIALGIVIALV